MSTSRPAGWYRDPSERHEHRWWNGTGWTPHVITLGLRSIDHGTEPPTPSPVVAEPVAPATASEPHRWPLAVWVVVLAGAALLVLGAGLPWAEADSTTSSFSADGIDGNGAITIVAAVLMVLALVVVQRPALGAALVIGIATIAGAVGVHDTLDISRKADDLVDHGPAVVSAGVGIGLWVTLVGAVIALIGGGLAFVAALRSR